MTKGDFVLYATKNARKAVILEAATTPKPGLVDRQDSGAHRDMNFFTFLKSSNAIFNGLLKCTDAGVRFQGKDSAELMDFIRKPGMECEASMLKATNNVNTHKGAIFSLGILLAAAGKVYSSGSEESYYISAGKLCGEVRAMTKGLVEKDFAGLENKRKLTHGEYLFKLYGIKGIRGEVEDGFPMVREYGLPVIRGLKAKGYLSLNEIFIQVLMNIMAHNLDTNVLARAGQEGLEHVKERASEFIYRGGVLKGDYRRYLQDMNKDFIKRNISPGGTADLLAVSIFLATMEGIL